MQRATACNIPQTTLQRQRATDNRQQSNRQCRRQTACRRTRAHARCNRKHTALPHFVCGEQRAAGNQQHARSIVLDNQCATRHRRHTRCNTRPYDPCRSMHQTQTEPTTRSRQCNVRDETNEIRTLAHLGARCACGGGVGWTVGLGVTSQSSRATRRRNRPREIRCPNLARPKWMQGERD